MAAPTVEVTLVAQFVEEKKREGKDPYYNVHFQGAYTCGGFNGNTAAVWSPGGAGIVRERLVNVPGLYSMRGSEKNPTYSASITRIVDPSTGEVLWQEEKRQGGGGGGKGGQRGPGDWETHHEREFKAASIDASVAAKVLAEMADPGMEPTERVAFVVNHVEELARAIRKATRAVAEQEGGYPQKAAAPPPADAPASGSAPPPAGGGAAQGPSAGTPAGGNGQPPLTLALAKNAALQRFGNLSGVEAAYAQAFGSEKKLSMMDEAELKELLDWAQLTGYGASA